MTRTRNTGQHVGLITPRNSFWHKDPPFAAMGSKRRAKLGDKRRSCAAIPKGLVAQLCLVPTGKGKGQRIQLLGAAWSRTRVGTGFTRFQLNYLRAQSGMKRPAKIFGWLIAQQKLAARGILKPIQETAAA